MAGSKRKSPEKTKVKFLEKITKDDSNVEMIGQPKHGAKQSTMKKAKKNDVKKKGLILEEIFAFTEVEEREDKRGNEKWHDNGLPSLVNFKTVTGKSDVWKFMRVLCIPVTQKVKTHGRKAKPL